MTKKVNIVKFFSRVLVLGNSMRINKRQSIQLCSPHVEDNGFITQMYADDSQINGSRHPGSARQLQHDLSSCLDEVSTWMCANWVQLNTSKTDVIWCITPRRQQQLPTTEVRVGVDYVTPSKCVRNLITFIDSDVIMKTQVTRSVASCFVTLRQLRAIRQSVSDPVF